ncbi:MULTISPECIES: hypothetical protein [Mesorhizobium]|nr:MULTISPECIES: hypothetical protein [Mesorhizobium]
MKAKLAKILGDVSARDCAIAALFIVVLAVPATCMVLPHHDDDMLESIRE